MPSPYSLGHIIGASTTLSDAEILRTVVSYCNYLLSNRSQQADKWKSARNVHAARAVVQPSLLTIDFKSMMAVLSDLGVVKYDSNRTTIFYNASKLKSVASLPVRIMVKTQEQCERSVKYLRECRVAIAIDSQGASDHELCLVQVISSKDRNQVYLFDMCMLSSTALASFRTLLEDPNVLKIGHDLRLTAKLLSLPPLRAKVTHVLDTQVVYRAVINNPYSNSDLFELLTKYKIKMHMETDPKYRILRNSRNIWKYRPLGEAAVQYACARVEYVSILKTRLQNELLLKLEERSTERILKYAEFDGIDKHDPQAQPLGVDLWIEFDSEGKPTYTPVLDTELIYEDGSLKTEVKSEDEESPLFTFPNGSNFGAGQKRSKKKSDPDLDMLLNTFPDFAREAIVTALESDTRLKNKQIVDIKVDADRPIVVGLSTHDVILNDSTRREGVEEYIEKLGDIHFSDDNRGGISGSLHRVSVMRSRARAQSNSPLSNVVGITYRIGRARFGDTSSVIDLLHRVRSSQTSLLILGAPGRGKSTLLRSCIRYVAHDLSQSTVVVDTSNELGGDGIAPHPVIQPARRMMVPERNNQYVQLLEAVQNHSPKVVVVDELATKQETMAIRSISQRGVSVLATAHGTSLDSLLSNPDLKGLMGGTQLVILSSNELSNKKRDASAPKKSGSIRKSQVERAGVPPFQCAVELVDFSTLVVHHDVAGAVDNLLADGKKNRIETRKIVCGGTRVMARFSMI